jgi:hypothetical protein
MLEIRPIVVNEHFIVLGGNMRLKACIEAGLKEIPIIKASELTPEQQREFIIKDNVGFGEWDWNQIGEEWDTDKTEEWGLDTWKEDPFAVDSDDTTDPNGEDVQRGKEATFDDEGIVDNSQYGVIVMCVDEAHQEKIYKELSNSGFECKVVVT